MDVTDYGSSCVDFNFILSILPTGVISSPNTGATAATPGEDFVPVFSNSFTITANVNPYRLQLQLVDDEVDEPDESFILTLSVIGDASITRAQTTITITDNDPTEPLSPPGRSTYTKHSV